MSVRDAKPDDARSIAEVHVATWKVAYQGLIPQELLDKLSVDKRETAWSEILSNDQSRTVVQEIEGQIAGFINLSPIRDKDGDRMTTGEITSVYVMPQFQGRGVGRRLMQFAFDHFREDDLNDVKVWVLESNRKACEFYKRLGMKPDGGQKTEYRDEVALVEIRYSISLRSG